MSSIITNHQEDQEISAFEASRRAKEVKLIEISQAIDDLNPNDQNTEDIIWLWENRNNILQLKKSLKKFLHD